MVGGILNTNTYVQFVTKDFNINRLSSYILADYQNKNSGVSNFRIYSKTVLNVEKQNLIIECIEKYIIFEEGTYKDQFSQKLNYIYISPFYFDENDIVNIIKRIFPKPIYDLIIEEQEIFKSQLNSHQNVEFDFVINNVLYFYDILVLQIQNTDILSINDLNPCYNYIFPIDDSFYYHILYNIVENFQPLFQLSVL